MELKQLLENLKKPVSYKWKIQSVPKNDKKGNCVAYIDARDCMDTLDLFCEEGWQNEFYEVKWKVFCRVGIKIKWEWFYRSDSWALEESEHVEHETTSKWETSDAFKRACVQWGIWRFLYEKDIIWISNEEYQANKFKINEFCKSKEWKTFTPSPKENPPNNIKQKELMEYIEEIRLEKDVNHIKTLVNQAWSTYKTEKQIAWITKEARERTDKLDKLNEYQPWNELADVF